MKRAVLSTVFASIWLVGAAPPQRGLVLPEEAQTGALAFVGARVLDVEADRLSSPCTVIVEDGIITSIGDDPPGPECLRIDGVGRVLMPGLIDSFVQLSDSGELVMHLAHGVTSVRAVDVKEALLEPLAELRAGRRLGPSVSMGSPPLEAGGKASERALRVQLAARLGYDFLTLADLGRQREQNPILKRAEAAGLPWGGPPPPGMTLEDYLALPSAACDRVESLLDREQGLPAPMGEERVEAAIAALRASGKPVTTTLVGFQALIPQIEHRARLMLEPEMAWIDPASREIWDSHGHGLRRGYRLERLPDLKASLAFQLELTGRLFEAGIPLVAGTEAMTAFVIPGLAMHEELALLVQAGLAPIDALRAATTKGAELLGREDLGRVAVGQRADLLLLEGDPRLELGVLRRPLGVAVGGAFLTRAQLDRELEELRELYDDEARFITLTGAEGLMAAIGFARERLELDAHAHVLREEAAERVGLILELSKRRIDAAAYSLFCLELWPASAWAHRQRARVVLERGERAEARVAARRALELDPQDLTTTALLARCENPPRAPRPRKRLSAPFPTPGPTDWPRFRGPRGSGVLIDGALPVALDPARDAAWRTRTPAGYSSPVLDDKRVYLTGHEQRTLTTTAVDRVTGAVLWQRPAPRDLARKARKSEAPAGATPACDGERVVVLFGNYGLVAYDVQGEELWKRPLGPFRSPYGMPSSLVIHGDIVLALCDHEGASFLVAVDRRDGRELWRQPRPRVGGGTTTPLVLELEGRAEVIVPGSFRLIAHDLDGGRPLWWIDEMAWGITLPVLADERVLVHSWLIPPAQMELNVPKRSFAELVAETDHDLDGALEEAELEELGLGDAWLRYDADRDGRLDASEWEWALVEPGRRDGVFALRPGGDGELSASRVDWRCRRPIPGFASMLYDEGRVYFVRDGGVLVVLDAGSGRVLSQQRIEGAADRYFASPVAGDGRLYTASETGLLAVLSMGDGPVLLGLHELGEDVIGTPALADGCMYVRSREALYAFTGRKVSNGAGSRQRLDRAREESAGVGDGRR